MMRPIPPTPFAALCALLLLTWIPVSIGQQPAAGQPKLDGRIDPSKITETPSPPLPEPVILPKPPEHRIAMDPELVPISGEHYRRAQQAIATGLDYLQRTQAADGGWMTDVTTTPTDQPDTRSPVAVAVTAMIVKAMAQTDRNDRQSMARALTFLKAAQREDGSFDDSALANYITSIVTMALATLDDPAWHDRTADALQWLKGAQWDGGEGLSTRQDWFGGAGYGKHGRPDLSNTQTMLDALYDAGVSPDEPAFEKATAFLSRAQNLEATNPSSWAGNDGGFVYTPANGGESMASEHAGEGRYGTEIPEGQFRSLRSYGSMTYAGFKSLLYAGCSANDPRIKAAFDWIRTHWTFDENPGMGQQGLYYYYHTMSRALNVGQQVHITDDQAVRHNWREELIDSVAQRQRQDGSWLNPQDRWLEGHPALATAYAVLALEEALKPVATETTTDS